MTSETFQTFTAQLIYQTINCCRSILDQAGIGVKQLAGILMVGGSSNVPFAKDMVEKFAEVLLNVMVRRRESLITSWMLLH